MRMKSFNLTRNSFYLSCWFYVVCGVRGERVDESRNKIAITHFPYEEHFIRFGFYDFLLLNGFICFCLAEGGAEAERQTDVESN